MADRLNAQHGRRIAVVCVMMWFSRQKYNIDLVSHYLLRYSFFVLDCGLIGVAAA